MIVSKTMSRFFIYIYEHLLLVAVLNLELGAHRVRRNGGQVKDADRLAGVGWLGAEVAVGVTQVAADRLGETNLGTGIQEVLARQDGVWRKLTEILSRHHLLGNQAHVGVVVHGHVDRAHTGSAANLERGWLVDRVECATWSRDVATALNDAGSIAGWLTIVWRGADWVVACWGVAATLRIKYHHGNQEQKNQNCQTFAVHVIIVYDFFFQSR